MAPVVPEPGHFPNPKVWADHLGQTLDALLELTGATAGWVGLAPPLSGPGNRMSFPAQRGEVSPAWFTLQQGQAQVWGFAMRDGVTLLNDLPPSPLLGDPALHNLISCPLTYQGQPAGQVVLANKSTGFSSSDAIMLRTAVHLLSQQLSSLEPISSTSSLPMGWRMALERCREGVFVLEEDRLLFVNSTWTLWTGFSFEELLQTQMPFPFWISHRDLTAQEPGAGIRIHPPRASTEGPAVTDWGPLPFRRRDGTLFWCQVESVRQLVPGHSLTIAFLRPCPASLPEGQKLGPAFGAFGLLPLQTLADHLPFAAALTDGDGRLLGANGRFFQLVAPAVPRAGQALGDCFTPLSAAMLESILPQAEPGEKGCLGTCLLHLASRPGNQGALTAGWLTVRLPTGPVFLFAFAEDWSALTRGRGQGTKESQGFVLRPSSAAGWLALILQENGEVSFWNERWEKLTGLSQRETLAAPGELVLDLLFPRQPDRNFVADLLRQPETLHSRHALQAVLEMAGHARSQPLSCTFLPLGTRGQGHWLLLVSEPGLAARAGPALQHFIEQVTEGLRALLAQYLAVSLQDLPPTPQLIPEDAAQTGAFPLDLAAWVTQVLEAVLEATHRFAQWENVSTTGSTAYATADELQLLSPTKVLLEILEEGAVLEPRSTYELTVDLPEDEVVCLPDGVLQRLLRLLLSASEKPSERATGADPARHSRREVRVFVQKDRICCAVRDKGEAWAPLDWPEILRLLSPRAESASASMGHALLDATGLTLMVGRSLPAQPEIWLGLRTAPAEGTSLLLTLPRVGAVSPTVREPLRADAPASPSGPHAKPATPATESRPES
jgi:PAS domain-containing protein